MFLSRLKKFKAENPFLKLNFQPTYTTPWQYHLKLKWIFNIDIIQGECTIYGDILISLSILHAFKCLFHTNGFVSHSLARVH